MISIEMLIPLLHLLVFLLTVTALVVDITSLALEGRGGEARKAWLLHIAPLRGAAAVVVVVLGAVDALVRAERDELAARVDALADGGLPPAGPAPVGLLAHVDAGLAALGHRRCTTTALGLELGGLEVGGDVEGFVVPLGVVGQGCRGNVGRGRGWGGCDGRGDGRRQGQEDCCVSDHFIFGMVV